MRTSLHGQRSAGCFRSGERIVDQRNRRVRRVLHSALIAAEGDRRGRKRPLCMGSDSLFTGAGPRPTETPRPGSGPRQAEPPPRPLLVRGVLLELAANPYSPPTSGFSADLMLEIERLRAERDAMAAELQIERAERLRAEERLRMFEREKLEQMREGAASREKLASGARRGAAARDARRGPAGGARRRPPTVRDRRAPAWPLAVRASRSADDSADEIAEPSADGRRARARAGGPAAATGGVPGRRGTTPGSSISKYSRAARGAARAAEAAQPAAPPARARRRRAAAGRRAVRPARADGRSHRSGPRSAGGGPQRREPSAGVAGAGARTALRAGARRMPAATAGRAARARARLRPPEAAPLRGARGGAAAGRPSIDRAQLEARLAAGAAHRDHRPLPPVPAGGADPHQDL